MCDQMIGAGGAVGFVIGVALVLFFQGWWEMRPGSTPKRSDIDIEAVAYARGYQNGRWDEWIAASTKSRDVF